MCLAVPLEIIKIDKEFALAKAGSLLRKINIQMLPGLKKGDYCLVHAGFAIQKIDRKAARLTQRLMKQIGNVKLPK